jgi:hypothetical protein
MSGMAVLVHLCSKTLVSTKTVINIWRIIGTVIDHWKQCYLNKGIKTVLCTIHPQFGAHIPVHDYEMYIIYIFIFTNQCNIWGISGSISVYYMLYALMLYSGASVASFMFCFTGDCISHLIIIAAYSFIITYLLMLYTCIHTHKHTHTEF